MSNEFRGYKSATLCENEKYQEYSKKKELRIREGCDRFADTGDLFGNITEYAIQLSNLCNYAFIHTKCPANSVSEKIIMSSDLFHKIIDDLSANQFKGTICFHLYNEPMIDPRLFQFIQYINHAMPEAEVEVYTNGYYLNQTMASELVDAGTTIIICTAYNENEFDRLSSLNVECAFRVFRGILDDRLDRYSAPDNGAPNQSKCRTMITQTPIFPDGDVGYCCMDYKKSVVFGNVNNGSLKDCIQNEKAIQLQKSLLNGDRSVNSLCTNCGWLTN